ncbi:MAG: hypothetical protein HRU14_16710 [Planctomycetes bacterium]|nr:hypothetical protein [Planctomycetota bacterium]
MGTSGTSGTWRGLSKPTNELERPGFVSKRFSRYVLSLIQQEKNDLASEQSRRVEKPWGFELIWAETERYVGKVISIRPGQRLSLQYHEVKDESIQVMSGQQRLHLENAEGQMQILDLGPGEHSRIPVGRKHRFEALHEPAELVEVSTPELNDVVRLEDDYSREGTNEP